MSSPSPSQRLRAYWLKTLHEWHWISAALSLVGMLLFAITGFTLNHAGQIEARPHVTTLQARVPTTTLAQLTAPDTDRTPFPPALQTWAHHQWGIDTANREAEWSSDEIYLSLPRPGGDAWLRISLPSGDAEYERTDRGWISYFNDLHKGRNTGVAWSWFIDLFAVACVVFSLTGLLLLSLHARKRPLTWPVVGLGLVIPAVLALLWIH